MKAIIEIETKEKMSDEEFICLIRNIIAFGNETALTNVCIKSILLLKK